MPPPVTNEDLLGLVTKSGVADAKRLNAYLKREGNDVPQDPAELAVALVREGILTNFQVQQLLQGKWRGFAIGNYKVLERLGSGGMGNVYLCEHQVMRKRVAIKVLATVSAENPEALKRFYREARAAAALDHPHIVRAHDVGKEEKLHFLVMDFVDGSSLENIIRRHGPMDVLRACHYIKQAAMGLHFAHEAGLIHRDIKPANLMLDRTGVVKVLDMGVARFAQEEDEVLTKGPLGTADYLAPEQALDSHGADRRADIYSLGAAFYFMLTGNPPFTEGKTVAQKIMLLQTKPPTAISEYRNDVPHAVESIITRMMAKKPDQRYQTLQEMIEDMEPLTERPIPPPPEREMPAPVLVGGGEGTDVNLGMTPVGGPVSGSGRKLRPKTLMATPAVPEEPPAPQSSIALAIVLSVLATAAFAVGFWWTFLRPGH
jgi:serine/threonine protein kinase